MKRYILLLAVFFNLHLIICQVEETKFKQLDPYAIKENYGINPFHSENSLISDSTLIRDFESQLKNYYSIEKEKIKKIFENKLDLDKIKSKDSLIHKVQKKDTNFILENHKWEDQWKLVAFQEFMYREQGETQPIIKKDAYHYDASKTNKRYPTSELFEFCSLSENKFIAEFPLTYVPEIYEQNQPNNFQWTISYLPCKIEKCKELGMYTASIPNHLFCEEYHSEFLLVRYVNNYPNGGATSWYEEKVFFFKKVKS